jgi:hypothetical protein
MVTEHVPGVSVTDVRRALIAESEDFYKRRKPYFASMRADASPAESGPAFDAYEGLVAAGAYGWLLAAMLRKLSEDHGATYAEDFAALVAEVMESGVDWLEDANDDLAAEAAA